MKIVFSRKGFDSACGGGPSPIVDGRPVTLPIPLGRGVSATSYGDLGLGDHVARASRGRLGAGDACHHDPMFRADGTALLGQCDGAQTHLARRGVGAGDLFVFFGLFAHPGERPHHRIFGYLRVAEVVHLARAPREQIAALRSLRFPHALAMLSRNDAVYRGAGRMAWRACDDLLLTAPGCSASIWQVPRWLREVGLSYHARIDRWLDADRLRTTSPGQEFVADTSGREDALAWAERIVEAVERRF